MKVMITTLIVIAAVIIVLAVTVVLSSGIYLPKKYYDAWNPEYHKHFSDARLQVIAHGLLAANSHNMQAWKIVLDDSDKNGFWLYINADKLTPQVDPYSRQITISQGTFLEYVTVASEKLGYQADITLFPKGEFDDKGSIESIKSKPVAKVTLEPVTAAANPIYSMMFLPDTVRVAYQPGKLPADLVSQMESLSSVKIVVYQDDANLEKLKEMAWESANIEAGVDRIARESAALFRPNEYEKNKYRYGFSLEGQGFSGINITIIEALLTLIPSMNTPQASNDSFLSGTRTALDNTPAFFMIVSMDNSRTTQVRMGMLYSHFQLVCQARGYYMQPMSQALEEYPEMKSIYEKIHAEYARPGETIQMLARVGKPIREVEHSMRLGVNDLLAK
jgi:nitroreductase